VSARMDEGISYTEFSYMLLQSYDYLELFRRYGVKLQMGGSDQWGNITAGIELIRRTDGGVAHALTAPLVTTASGAKFGKSEGNAVWLDPRQTSPYAFYQFWMHVDDRDIGRYLRFFTLMPRADITELDVVTKDEPEKREAQQLLARDVTARVHGVEGLRAAEEVTGFYFGGGEPTSLSNEAFEILRTESPFAEVDVTEVSADGDATRLDVIRMLVRSGLADSNGAARRLLQQGGVSINKRKLGPDERAVAASDVLLSGRHVIVGKGKRDYALLRVR
jgi:tyrosyl-tRNA synthetase